MFGYSEGTKSYLIAKKIPTWIYKPGVVFNMVMNSRNFTNAFIYKSLEFFYSL